MRQSYIHYNWRKITESKLFFPLAALVIILLFDLTLHPKFFSDHIPAGAFIWQPH